MVSVVDVSKLELVGEAPPGAEADTDAEALSAEESGPSEMDVLDPEARYLTLESANVDVEIVPLRTRQLFRLLRIVTHGLGARLGNLDFTGGSDVFVQQLLTMVFMAIPDAEDETLDFLRSMVQPQGLAGQHKPAAKLTKQETEINEGLWRRVSEALFNPDPADLVSLVERIIKLEAPNIQSLGKQVMAILPAAWKEQLSQAASVSQNGAAVS